MSLRVCFGNSSLIHLPWPGLLHSSLSAALITFKNDVQGHCMCQQFHFDSTHLETYWYIMNGYTNGCIQKLWFCLDQHRDCLSAKKSFERLSLLALVLCIGLCVFFCWTYTSWLILRAILKPDQLLFTYAKENALCFKRGLPIIQSLINNQAYLLHTTA